MYCFQAWAPLTPTEVVDVVVGVEFVQYRFVAA